MSKSMMKKTLLLSSSTLVSRVFGLIRELILPRYLGVGIISDAYMTAFRIPNSLRKIFAEGALSAACIPTIVRVVKEQGREQASHLITSLFVIVEGCILLFCGIIALYADTVIHLMVPGWSAEQVAVAVPLLKIFIFFIFFVSSSALLAAALQAVHHYIFPIFAQIMLNVVIIAGTIVCLRYNLPVTTFAWSIVLGGLVMLLIHIAAYYRHNFAFLLKHVATRHEVKEVLRKFGPSLLSVGIIEINFFISNQFASYLPAGSITLYSYASNFMRLPMGVLIIPFSNILFTHFSRISTYAPKRLSYYVLETSKLIWWGMLPIICFMSLFAYDIFATMYLSEKFPVHSVVTAQWLLIIMLTSLFFFSCNKILLNVYYALHETFVPSMITLFGAVTNTVLDVILMRLFGIYGLAWATSIAAVVQTILFLFFLRKKFHFTLYGKPFAQFALRSLVQLCCGFALLYAGFVMIRLFFLHYFAEKWALLFTQKMGLWLWLGPLFGLICLLLLLTRKFFGLKMHFIDG